MARLIVVTCWDSTPDELYAWMKFDGIIRNTANTNDAPSTYVLAASAFGVRHACVTKIPAGAADTSNGGVSRMHTNAASSQVCHSDFYFLGWISGLGAQTFFTLHLGVRLAISYAEGGLELEGKALHKLAIFRQLAIALCTGLLMYRYLIACIIESCFSCPLHPSNLTYVACVKDPARTIAGTD